LKDYQSLVQVLEHYGAAIGAEGPYLESVKKSVKMKAPDNITEEELRKRQVTAAKLQSVDIGFLKRADSRRYGGLWSELENNFSRGQDHYPADLTSAYNLLLNYKAAPIQRAPRRENNDEAEVSGMCFLQNSGPVAGTDGVTHATVKCYGCNIFGHYSSACPNEAQDGVQMLQVDGMNEGPGEEDEYVSEPKQKISFLHKLEQDTTSSHLRGSYSTASPRFRFLRTAAFSPTSGRASRHFGCIQTAEHRHRPRWGQ
jgi:hypothetical protein